MTTGTYQALIVDDELPIRTLMRRALEERGFQCEEMPDGEQAFQHLQHANVDLVVTDLRMPAMNGHRLCVQLLERQPRPVIAVLTGLLEPRLSRDLERRGVDIIRNKPTNFRQFAKELEQIVGKKAQSTLSDSDTESVDSGNKLNELVAFQGETFSSSKTKHIICILLRDHSKAQQLSTQLEDETIEPFIASSTDDLYQFLEGRRIDLLVIDQEPGGFLSGMEIVERLNRELVRPRVVLLGIDDEAHQTKADNLGVALTKPSSRDVLELAQDVRRILNDDAECDAFIPPLARRLVHEFGEIPLLPQLIVKLAGYMAIPIEDISLDELARDISTDSKAATELLRITNSASTGLNKPISNVAHAVKLHGPKKAISFVLCSAAMDVQKGILKDWNESLRQWYQKRSVLIAATASTFAGQFENTCSDTAFILGLMQDIGCVVLTRKYGHKYEQVVQRFRSIGQAHLEHLERSSFPVDHAQISGAVLQKWKLPRSLIRPIVSHHDPQAHCELSQTDLAYIRVMQVGETLANTADLSHPFRTRQLDRLLSGYGPHKARDCKAAIAKSLSMTRQMCELFSFPLPEASEVESILHDASDKIVATE